MAGYDWATIWGDVKQAHAETATRIIGTLVTANYYVTAEITASLFHDQAFVASDHTECAALAGCAPRSINFDALCSTGQSDFYADMKHTGFRIIGNLDFAPMLTNYVNSCGPGDTPTPAPKSPGAGGGGPTDTCTLWEKVVSYDGGATWIRRELYWVC